MTPGKLAQWLVPGRRHSPADPDAAAARLCGAAACGHRLQLRAAADILPLADAGIGELPDHLRRDLLPSFAWSLALALITVIILALLCYPLAYGLAKVFGRWANAVTLVLVLPLFVSENLRLYGWILFFIKNGVLLGSSEVLLRHRARKLAVHADHDRVRHGLCLSALHALPHDARRVDGAAGNGRSRRRSRRQPAGRCSTKSNCRWRCPASSSAAC